MTAYRRMDDLSPVHTSDNVAKNGDIVAKSRDNVAETGYIVAKNGNNIKATLSKQLLVFNPVAMPPQLDFVFSWGGYKSMGLGTEVSSGVQGQSPCMGLGTVSQKLNHFDMCLALFCP